MSTFGYDQLGATTGPNGSAKTAYCSKFVSPADFGTVTLGGAWLKNANASARTCEVCIYADSAGAPGALLATSGVINIAGSDPGTRYTAALNFVGAPGTTYWLVVFFNSTNAGGEITYGAGGTSYTVLTPGTAAPNPMTSGGTAAAELISVFVTYTPTNSSTPRILGTYTQ